MADTAADVLIETLHHWGVEVIFGLPGDGINGIMEALRKRAGPDPLRPGAPRGVGRLHGLRLRQVHRQARRLPGDLGPGRHPSAQRPLRRQARRPAGAGHHRHALPRPDRHASPSRTWSSTSCSSTSPSTTRASWARPTSRTSRTSPAGRRSATAASPTSPSRSTSRTWKSGGSGSQAQRAASHLGRVRAASAGLPAEADLRARGRHPERGQARSPSWPAAARCSAGDELEAVAERSARRSSRRCSARPRCPTTARTRPAASACSARARRRRRWRTATPC